MATTCVEQAESKHLRLISALAEFQASQDTSDAMLGAHGLVIVYDYALECEVVTVKVTIFHSDGAWIKVQVPCPGIGIDQLEQARSIARSAVLGSAA